MDVSLSCSNVTYLPIGVQGEKEQDDGDAAARHQHFGAKTFGNLVTALRSQPWSLVSHRLVNFANWCVCVPVTGVGVNYTDDVLQPLEKHDAIFTTRCETSGRFHESAATA